MFSLHMLCSPKCGFVILTSGEFSCIWFRMNKKSWKRVIIFRPFSFPPAYFASEIPVALTDWCALDRLLLFWDGRPDSKTKSHIPQLNLLFPAVEQMWLRFQLVLKSKQNASSCSRIAGPEINAQLLVEHITFQWFIVIWRRSWDHVLLHSKYNVFC